MRLIIHFGGKKVVKGTRENDYICSFISKKSKNSCGVIFSPKFKNICVGTFLVVEYHEF
jgi:hypothetical protein